MGSQVIDVVLALVCLAVGVLHLGTASGRLGEAVAHGVMGLGMAAMFVPAADPLPRWVWLGAFGALAVWAAAAAARERSLAGHGVHHLVGAAAMLFMVLTPAAAPGTPAGGGHHHGAAAGAGGASLLLAVVALTFTAWFVADVARTLSSPAPDVAREPRTDGGPVAVAVSASLVRLLRPARIAMSAAMAVMLVAA
ncbi:DUF5134 domain-containing protein [Pseudonocardia sp.]|uniref:DUF5134 domain-containing protein n=1 Tax=Pseudonocardia sp. TaxID=60912 RepID=UPI003D0E9B77